MYNYILFDLDGTLTDPAEGITNSVSYALEKFGIIVSDKRELYKFIGPPLVDSFMEYYGFSEEDANKAVAYYREYFKPKGIYENAIYDGTVSLLSELKKQNKTVILATSKPELFAKEILKYFSIDGYFDFVAGATMDKTRNKKSDVIAYALSECEITDLKSCLMVGDRNQDINGARANGIDSVGVLYGYGDRQEHEAAGATYIAETVEDILKFVIN
ncbi:MAG: HAD family hydrolase [Ruminococcaceae bacterium]|nr:HAD family hydrolase [Oscillospiraceae bacterium]